MTEKQTKFLAEESARWVELCCAGREGRIPGWKVGREKCLLMARATEMGIDHEHLGQAMRRALDEAGL